jgi:hypothetical protein
MSKIISLVINCDTRIGYLNDKSTIGDFGGGSLQGVRSLDLLTDGIAQKINFFRGYNLQVILYIDLHEGIDVAPLLEINDMVNACGNNSKVICKPHNREEYKWNDKLYIEALRLAEGDYIVHFDGDSNAYRKDDCDIIERYFKWLDEGYKYICQPWDRIGDPMYHASTRFLICKRETLDLPQIEKAIYWGEVNGLRNPCLEFTIAGLAGSETVLYPPREDSDYIVFCWARYYGGLLKHLNNLSYEGVKEYILGCGLFGSHDIIAKPVTNE